MTQQSAEKIQFVEAHSCVFEGRHFAHVVLKYRGKIISLLVTDTDLPANGTTITNQSNDSISIAGFNVARHAVFVISNLSEPDNTTIVNIISTAIQHHIEKAEA